jgi:hypothetical protein
MSNRDVRHTEHTVRRAQMKVGAAKLNGEPMVTIFDGDEPVFSAPPWDAKQLAYALLDMAALIEADES